MQDLTKNTTKDERPNSFFTMVNPKTGEEYPANETRTWSITRETFSEYYAKGKIVFPGDYDFLKIKRPAFRVFESEDKEKAIRKYGTADVKMSVSTYLPEKEVGRTEHGSKEIRELFGAQVFSYPKPTGLIRFFIENISDPDAIIMDFFAGSGTTADAVIRQNLKDGGRRKFVLVQLPEPLDPNKKEQKTAADYCKSLKVPLKISELTKERIRRVIKKIEEERAARAKEATDALPGMVEEMPELDLGFKVLKLDRSNFKPWEKLDADASEEEISKAIQQHLFHIDPGASQEDILYEILLKAGFSPAEKVEKLELAGKTVFSIADGALLICLEDEITRELIDAVAEAEPMQFICLDQGFKGNDQLKTNAVQTFAARNQGRDKAGQIVFRTV